MPQKTPQDHKPADGSYTFTVNGKKHRLPPLNERAAMNVNAGAAMDAILADDDLAQVRLGLLMLRNAGISDTAMAALRSLTFGELQQHLEAWSGESSGSSDS